MQQNISWWRPRATFPSNTFSFHWLQWEVKGDSFSNNGSCKHYSSLSFSVHSILQDTLIHTGLWFQMQEENKVFESKYCWANTACLALSKHWAKFCFWYNRNYRIAFNLHGGIGGRNLSHWDYFIGWCNSPLRLVKIAERGSQGKNPQDL